MIAFEPTEEQESIRTSVHEFAEQVMRPLARECDEASEISDAFLAQAWELGLVSTQIPEQYGGYGAPRSPLTNVLVLEELAYGDVTLAIAAVAPALFANAVLDQGSEAQRAAYLPPFCGSDYYAATLAVAEATPDFDALHPRTQVVPAGAGYTLNGTKFLVPMGDRAAHLLVIASAGDRLDAFIVARDTPGVNITAPERNLGLRGLCTATVEFSDVALDAAARLGGDSGCDVARLLNHGRTAQAALLVGLSRAVLDFCIPYSKERVAFDEPIARKESIAFRLAEMHMETECSRWLAWKAAARLERGLDATRDAHFARLYTAEKAMWIADNGVQVLGGHGFIREHPVEMWYRNARTLGVVEGIATL